MIIKQPTSRPTNKLTAAMVVALAVSLVSMGLRNLAPEWYDPATMAALSPVLIGLVGYFTPDAANV